MFKHLLRRLAPSRPGRRIPLADLCGRDRLRNQEEIRARCRTVVVRSDMAVTQILGRYKMFVDPGDYSLAVHLMMDGYWEMWLTEELLRLVKPGMVVADIGANLGYFTLIMADLVGPQGHVLAFEPNPHVAGLLQRSLRVNGMGDWASIEQSPLGAVSGLPVTLCFNPEQAGGAFVSDGENEDFSVAIPHVTRRFDEHPRAHQVSVVKIDAEGSEERIWEGMAALIAGKVLRIVVMEWCSFRYADPAGFLDAILAAGFSLAYIDPLDGVVPLDRDALLTRAPDQEWLLLLRR
ncbi:FkbM family methyltransferase [Sphingobium sp. CAP-1]|uniref:FkbM family methyltransferase n=1 Tax=Sphingobium sp. CAP-1 TaxID=2676077 RepID=UPI0012BB445C|nr:FkbM family methyltransferase [Sphingobium sp. CAP-1]QGP77599.1 FkbM family methyltransferase [Sphingobium sp. CAP-1]